MDFYRITTADNAWFGPAFALYQSSFPQHEQRVRDKQAAVLEHPQYHFDAVLQGDMLAGILLYWKLSGYTYIEHFAVHPDMRGNALGTKILAAFGKTHRPVVLEIDPPADQISIRREGFYHRLGFHSNSYPHAHPAYQKQFPPHSLVVMSYPAPMAQGEYSLFLRELEEIVMADAGEEAGGSRPNR